MIYNTNTCYCISLGKTHFVIKEYCENDFGIQLAQKGVDRNNVTLINANSFGGNRRKSITTYATNSRLEPEIGDSVKSIKAGTISNEFGKNVLCGDSIQLSIDEIIPSKIPELISTVNRVLTSDTDLFKIPTSRKITDPKLIAKLDKELAKAMVKNSEGITLAELIESSNFGFLFRGDFYLKYLVYKRNKIELGDNFDILSIVDLIRSKGLEVDETTLLSAKLKVETAEGQEFLKPLKLFIEYINPDKYYLHEGHWHQFNKKYIDQLDNVVSLIDFKEKSEFDNALNDHKNWIAQNNENPKVWYFEKYFNEYVLTQFDFINGDRDVVLSPDDDFRRYKLEISDGIKKDMLAFVKKGNFQKLNYVIDQSLASFKYLQENNWKVKVNSRKRQIKKMCLVLLLERGRFQNFGEIDSLIFKMKLNEWRRRLINSSIEPIVWVSFLKEKT